MKTREQEIKIEAVKEYGRFIESEEGAVSQHAFIRGANWADEHPKNPWMDAKSDPPDEDITVLILLKNQYWTRGFLRGNFWYAQRPQRNYYTRSGDVEYWMPIPETPKGGEK